MFEDERVSRFFDEGRDTYLINEICFMELRMLHNIREIFAEGVFQEQKHDLEGNCEAAYNQYKEHESYIMNSWKVK